MANIRSTLTGRKYLCPICKGYAELKLPLVRKTPELRTAERLLGKKGIGIRRVCEKCWFIHTVNACSKEEIAAAFILYYRVVGGQPEGWGRKLENRLERLIEKFRGIDS